MDIFERIASYRAENDRLAWSGTFKQYIELLRKDPSPAKTAHSRVYDMIKSHGVEDINGRKRYKFLNRRFLDLIVQSKSWSRNIFTLQHVGLMFANGFCY